jgi:ankyrin repeat protein
MLSFCKPYLRVLLLILLFSIPACLVSQIVVLDTTMELSNPLSVQEKLDLNNYLMLSASSGNPIAIDWLLRNGAEIDSKTAENATPLMLAVANNKIEAVKVLLKYRPDVNIKTLFSETPLLAAVKNGNLEIAEALIRDSANINLADKNGSAPLHYASIYGYFYLTDMLLYYAAEKDLKSEDGTTPLMAAIWSGYADIADLLIQKGANSEEKDNQGFTPLMVAAQNGDTVIMEMLLKKRVNMYEINSFNYDALDISIKTNQKEAIEYLFRKGYIWDKKLPNTINPYSVAVKYGRVDITHILERNQVPENHRWGFDQIAISASVKLCAHDYFTGINLAFKEPLINGGIIAGFDFKPGYTRVLVKVNENTYYQYQDKSAIAYGGIFKDIPITDHPYRGNWSFNSSVVAAYAFGNKLKGTDITPGNIFKIIPSVGFKLAGNHFSVYGNIDYMKTKFYKIGPVWLRLGLAYNMFLDNDRAPGKVIKWF